MRIVRVLAVIGLVISGYLLVLKLNGTITSIRGCGAGSGCANVLGSKWSQWFGIPVSFFSTLLYSGVIVLTFRPSKSLFITAATLLLGAAVWFIGLQIFVIKSFCPWCMGTHLIGMTTAIAVLKAAPKTSGYSYVPTALLAMIPLVILSLGQIFGPEPETHRIDQDESFVGQVAPKATTADDTGPVQMRGEGRVISFQGGAKSYRVNSLPILGSPKAKHILVKYFDYTCNSCFQMEEDIEKLLQKYPEEIAVIVLPSPMNRACNPYLPVDVHDHDHACELARLGLAAWRADPEKFHEAHKIIFARPITDATAARARLLDLISADKLDVALEDPWIDELLKANVQDYAMLTKVNINMPKMLISDKAVLQGIPRTTEIFISEIERVLKLP